MTTPRDEDVNESNLDEELAAAPNADEETVESLDDYEAIEDDGEPLADAFTLQSPEMAAKTQAMHEGLTLSAQLEAAIFASQNPMKAEDLLAMVSHKIGVGEIEAELQTLKKTYDERQGGFTLEFVKGLGYQFQSSALAAPIMAKMFASRPRPLSRAALETLAIIAYRQPCTRAAVEFIRGVDAGSIIKNLLERNLIKCVGRKEDAGRPMLFGTTDEFLHVFGIGNLKDLPPLSAFQPTSDTMRDSMKELEQLDAVQVEDFVTDEEEAAPEFGEGLLDEETLAEAESLAQIAGPEKLKGATLADEEEKLEVATEEEELIEIVDTASDQGGLLREIEASVEDEV